MNAKVVLFSLLTVVLNANASEVAEQPELRPITAQIHHQSASPCAHPKTEWGKIVAICGSRMVTFNGHERVNAMGIDSRTARFELASCNGYGGRTLNLETNSEGYQLTYADPYSQERLSVINMWGDFVLEGVDSEGKAVKSKCRDYTRPQKNIKYMYSY